MGIPMLGMSSFGATKMISDLRLCVVLRLPVALAMCFHPFGDLGFVFNILEGSLFLWESCCCSCQKKSGGRGNTCQVRHLAYTTLGLVGLKVTDIQLPIFFSSYKLILLQ